MPATRDGKTWRSQFYYEDWQGVRHKKNKRGFKTKAEAEEWERNFRQQQRKDLDINFENFVEIYFADVENRLRESTIKNKRYVFDLKVTPYFKKKKMCEITELNQWIASEKKKLATVMEQYGVEWLQKGTHEKHLSVLEFEKKERAREVAELDSQRDVRKYDEAPEWQLPEPGAFASAKSFRDKVVMPFVNKLKTLIKNLTIQCVRLKEEIIQLRKEKKRLSDDVEFYKGKIKDMSNRTELLQEKADDLERVKRYAGAEQIDTIIRKVNEQERTEQQIRRYDRSYGVR